MSNQKKSFLDSNTILAMVLTFIIFIGWQKYMESKYPKVSKETNAQETTKVAETQAKATPSAPFEEEKVAETLNIQEKTVSFDNDIWSFDLNSNGMSVDNVVIKKINKVAKKPYTFENTKHFYPTSIDGKVLEFDFKQTSENEFVGKALYKGQTVQKVMKVDSSNFTFDVKISVGSERSGKFSLEQSLKSNIQEPKNKVFFLPAFERNEFFVTGEKDEERKILTTSTTSETTEEYPSSSIASVGDEYFTAAFLNKGKILPKVVFNQQNSKLDLNVAYEFTDLINVNEIEYKLFIGPKNVDLLSEASPDLVGVINFMYLGFIAKPILKGLNFLYGIVGNYGWAVVILTLLIRLLIMPLTVSSLKSMKRMQAIQPELKKVKEKYKDQPQVVNQKTMEIMKKHKVNPLGGCLPMFLQMPIFFAFYRGLSESVDLYQAPFFGWITDLSKMDPYYVFPVLSMAGMVVHQMVTPSSMDKLQKRMMLFMPVVFGIFFITMPSALTIYMAISTWFGILQHTIFLKEKKA
ncbi:MAG: membrane protein insertase YidC [Bdellovibrionales bacterium]